MSWEQAKNHDGDFKDCLLHYLSLNLEMEVVNPPPTPGYTDGGVCEMSGVTTEDGPELLESGGYDHR